MKPAEVNRIRQEAIQRGRKERRAQGIPDRIEDDAMTARLASLLAPAEVVAK